MMPSLLIAPTTALNPDMSILREEAASEGFGFVDRLIDDWRNAANRFEKPGERFLGVFREGNLLAVCGLNRDPYVDRNQVGRLRHLYVLRSARREGIGSALVGRVLPEAKSVFQIVRLRTHTREAAEFYGRLGFVQVTDATSTHLIRLPWSEG
jgi:N-acetylglutamate synthase-like GNAT family acetyltransferase